MQKDSNFPEGISLNQLKSKLKIIFFFIGCLNNLCIEITLCYSNDLAKKFKHDKFMTIFHFIMLIFAMLIRIINAKYMLKIRHRIKNLLVVACFSVGILLMIIAFWKQWFAFTLFSMIFFGMGTSLGEGNNLGFLKGFPSEIYAGYTAGTGLSGLIGSTFYFLLKLFKFPFYAVNLSMLIFYPLYVLMFHLACVYKAKLTEFYKQSSDFEQEGSKEHLLDQLNVEDIEAKVNDELSFQNFKLVWPSCKFLFFSFFCLYLFEYVSNSWMTSHIVASFRGKYDDDSVPFFNKFGFAVAGPWSSF